MRDLYGYQAKAIKKILAHPTGGALLFEPGLGKTLTTIRAVQQTSAERMVVIGPVSAIGVWADELDTEGERVFVPSGSGKKKAQQISEVSEGWIILNYEALLNKDVEKAVRNYHADVVVLDEAHYIKNPAAKRSRAVHRISEGRRTLLLTGTPIVKNLLDLYSMYKAIDPEIWDGVTWTKFKQRYAVFGGFEGREVVGFRDTDDMQRRIRPFSVAATKDKALDLPPTRNQRVPVRLDGKAWKTYRDMAQEGVAIINDIEVVTTNPLTKALRLAQITGAVKVPYTVERINELLDAGQKVVVFHRFLAEGRAILEKLDTKRVYWVRGATPQIDRASYIKSFQEIPGPAVFLGQIQATSTAVTLTAASEVIFHSQGFSYAEAVQARDRVYRVGQEKPVRYQYMIATGPNGGKLIDDAILAALDEKQDFASMVMHNPAILEV